MRFAFKPLLIVATAINVFLFVSLFGHKGEGRPIFSAYVSHDTENYRLSDLYLLQKVVNQVERDYVDIDRIDPLVMFETALDHIQRNIPEVLFLLDTEHSRLTVVVDTARKTFPVDSIDSLRALVTTLRIALEFVENNLHTDLPLQEVEYSAINGILSTLDPHSVLLPPEVAREMDVQIQGEFGGLGITISLRGADNLLTIISTLPDTPASEAGLKAGDRILQIEDESTVNMTLSEAVSRLRGPVGVPVTILLDHQGWDQPKSLTIKRDTIRLNSVEWTELDDGIGYIFIKTFQHNTSRDLGTALEELGDRAGGLKGLVLDLRGNPGGPLAQAIEVADRFVDRGTIVTTVKGNGGDSEDEAARTRDTEDKYPLVVIADSESASASEIVAGALKNLDRAVVIGERTFGKGSVQNLYSYPNDAKLKLTMAKYLTPGRKSIQSVGIVPDIQLLPVYFDPKISYLYTTGFVFREQDLESHLEQGDILREEEAPVATLRYFSPSSFRIPGDDDAEEDPASISPPKEPDPREDFQVQFARDLISRAGRATRSSTLAQAKGFIRETIAEAEKEIQAHFAELGVDWSQGRSRPVSLTSDIRFGERGDVVVAGDTVQVTMTITNTGEHPAYRVRALTQCEVGAFGELEFLFGTIAPGETRTWSREVNVPRGLFPLVEPVRIQLFQDAETPLGETLMTLRVGEPPKPMFAYSLVIVDDGSGHSRGNGDGRIQRGEDIDLLILAKNIGRGGASKVFAKIRNTNGKYVYLRRGTVNFAEISSEDWSSGRFSFQVKPQFADDVVRFDIVLGSMQFGRLPGGHVSFPIESTVQDPAKKVSMNVEVTAKAPVEIRGCASERCDSFAQAAPGTVLEMTRREKEWGYVALPWEDDGVGGWVPMKSVAQTKSTLVVDASLVTPLFQEVPPIVRFRPDQLEVPYTTETLELRGEVFDDEAIQFMYVFVNNKKRLLQSINADDLEEVSEGVRLTFAQPIELDEGANTIEVYARDNHRLQSLDAFQIYRTPAAEARESMGVAASQPQ